MFDAPKIKHDLAIWISEGKTLREFCRRDGNPSYGTIYDWLEDDKDFASLIARARLIGEDMIAQECLSIADTPLRGQVVTEKGDGSIETKTADMVDHRKLQIYTRLQLLSKWNPKKYGDKVDMNLGGQENNPIQAAVTVEFVKSK